MSNFAAEIWVRAVGGELVRAEAIVGLRCESGEVEAMLDGGRSLQIAGPGCPADFHNEYLAELARARLLTDNRVIVILRAEVADGNARWIWTTVPD